MNLTARTKPAIVFWIVVFLLIVTAACSFSAPANGTTPAPTAVTNTSAVINTEVLPPSPTANIQPTSTPASTLTVVPAATRTVAVTATPAKDSGHILYVKWPIPLLQMSDIYMLDLNTGTERQLTRNTGENLYPHLSPDGTKITFRSNRMGKDQVFVMNADGSKVKQVTSFLGSANDPTWSPDSQKIIFSGDVENHAVIKGNLYVIDSDGKNQVRLTNHTAYDGAPRFSPDGKRVVYVQDNSDLMVMNADGTGSHAITSVSSTLKGGNLYDPQWSPDGRKIAYETYRWPAENKAALWVMDENGENLQQIADNIFYQGISWSPDGQRILFSKHEAAEPDDTITRLFTIGADGSNPQPLPKIKKMSRDSMASWEP